MLKRLVVGLVKGMMIGAIIGCGFHFGLGWQTTAAGGGLLAYLMAMGSGATAGVLAGKPPWRQQAWIESVLKGVAGIGLGALTYWVSSQWGSFALPSFVPGLGGTPWTESTLLINVSAAAVFGTLVELDNTGGSTPKRKSKTAQKVRVSAPAEVETAELADDPTMSL